MAEAELEEKTGIFQNEYTAKIQDIHEEFEVEILDLGLNSENSCRVIMQGTPEAINNLLIEVDDPRNPPDEPGEPIDPES